MSRAVILCLMLLLPAPVLADFYQFVDAEGVVHFTNAPTIKAQRILKEEGASGAAPIILKRSYRQSVGQFSSLVSEKADKYRLDPDLLMAVIKTESDFNPYAVSPKGAMGLMQLMPGTASRLGVKDSFDPAQNIDGGSRYLRYLLDYFNGSVSLALAAYNAGENAVTRWQNIPPYKETQQYVRKIMSDYRKETVPIAGGRSGQMKLASNIEAKTFSPRPSPIVQRVSEDGTVIFTNIP